MFLLIFPNAFKLFKASYSRDGDFIFSRRRSKPTPAFFKILVFHFSSELCYRYRKESLLDGQDSPQMHCNRIEFHWTKNGWIRFQTVGKIINFTLSHVKWLWRFSQETLKNFWSIDGSGKTKAFLLFWWNFKHCWPLASSRLQLAIFHHYQFYMFVKKNNICDCWKKASQANNQQNWSSSKINSIRWWYKNSKGTT